MATTARRDFSPIPAQRLPFVETGHGKINEIKKIKKNPNHKWFFPILARRSDERERKRKERNKFIPFPSVLTFMFAFARIPNPGIFSSARPSSSR